MRSRSVLFTLLLFGSIHAVPPVPGVQNHWAANSGGTQFDHIQNFIEDMQVKPDGSVYTWAYYDEGQRPYSIYKDGVVAGQHWDKDTANPHPSQRAVNAGVTWNIRHFYGRGFFGNTLAPPVGDSAPFVVSSRGDTLREIVDPTALAFDNSGRLMVADNGPEQNVKIYDVTSAPRRVATFGDSLGVFGGPVRGALGPKRFWGIRGLGVDAKGHVYVGCTGMPMQVGGGTHIRAFSGFAKTDTLIWELLGLAFVNTLDADPDSGGSSLYKNAIRVHMDYDKAPGKSWSFAAVTVDPFRYPEDPRLQYFSLESVWFRRIGGKRFLFLNSMVGVGMVVIRFEENSEIGIPTAFFPILYSDKSGQEGNWAAGKHPVWEGTDTSYVDNRWMWRDDNGNGLVEKEEFHRFKLDFPYTYATDVDDSGNIWWGGKPHLAEFRVGGLDARGIPRYPTDSIKTWPIPFSDNNMYVMELRYLLQKDAMILTSGYKGQVPSTVYRYDRWSDTARRKLTWRKDVPIKTRPEGTNESDQNVMDTCLYPVTMTADSDFVYMGYKDKGPDGWRNGEVSVIDSRNGERVGWIAPGPETNYMSGWLDLWHAINVFVRPNGERILMVEEDFAGKIMVYRWCPKTSCGAPDPTARSGPAKPDHHLALTRGGLNLDVPRTTEWVLNIRSLDGRLVIQKRGVGPTVLPLETKSGILYADLDAQGHRQVFPLLVR